MGHSRFVLEGLLKIAQRFIAGTLWHFRGTVPEGRLIIEFIRPSGTAIVALSEPKPSSELLGYFQESLRDNQLASFRPRNSVKNPYLPGRWQVDLIRSFSRLL